jgi:hypothetical protein
MTTHDQHTYTEPTQGIENLTQQAIPEDEQALDRQVQPDWSDGQGRSAVQAQTSPDGLQEAGTQPKSAVASVEPSSEQPVRQPAESASERALFADDELAGLTARWDNVQAGFVDDPRECVQKADGLVSDVVKQLTAGFSNTRTQLEEQWARGEEASTEDLRVALKQYREFFQRLLAV